MKYVVSFYVSTPRRFASEEAAKKFINQTKPKIAKTMATSHIEGQVWTDPRS